MENVEWTREFLRNIAPRGAACALVPPLEADESRWFHEAIEHCIFSVGECRSDCPRRCHDEVTQDEFLTPTGQHRHLFSISKRCPVRINREYVPHIAAVARAIIHFGFPAERVCLEAFATVSTSRKCIEQTVYSVRVGWRHRTAGVIQGDETIFFGLEL